MKARHITSETAYRNPYGAAPLGGSVVLGIDVTEDDVRACELRIWIDGEGETLLAMKPSATDPNHYEVTFTPEHVGLIWYSFNITASDGAVWRYGASEESSVGEGAFAYGDPRSFQITVYKPRADRPLWYQNAVVYQVFPDRFNRGRDWRERLAPLATEHRNGPVRRVVEDWGRQPSYERREDGSIAAWDFYGGTLEGVREKLGYLEALGVTCIYLNPIFEAASNHRYDTADYMRIDPLLGTEEDFSRLCADAERHGISIILDGVFNHTGCDSRYFNRYNNYPELGAWQDGSSPYRDWYLMDGETYASWWGVDDLPELNEENPDYREFICGEDGVVRKWLRLGARGWRLDVADELPDDFIADIRRAALAERPDAVIIGEVWEDATTKVAYGERRMYFEGDELDGTMNYPLRTALLGFITGTVKAGEMANTLEQLCENYPAPAFLSELNLLGSHDRERLFTVLGGAPDADSLSDEERAAYRLSEGQRGLAKGRLWMAALLQMTLPGVPCIYYGDECGMEGYRDPYNRATLPVDGGDRDCYTIYRNAIGLRKTLPVLTEGRFRPFAWGDDVFGFWRRGEDGSCVCVLANRSLKDPATVRLPMRGERVSDVISGKAPKVVGDECEVFLWPLGTAVLHFHKDVRMQQDLGHGMGVIAHITSIPHGGRPGTLGTPSHEFVDWLEAGGARYWQILPVNPTDEFGSPYAGLSAFAGAPALMEAVSPRNTAALSGSDELAEFIGRNEYWLRPYATFRAIKDVMGEMPWWRWPKFYQTYDPELALDKDLAANVQRHCVEQLLFERQIHETRAYANEHGVKIIGDMPMYVSADSSDVWAHRELFALDGRGRPSLVAGAPPDNMSADGQVWGNPCYRWDVHAASGYDWWMRRLERAFDLYDVVRLDHFLGFSSYYTIPYGEGAQAGSWVFGPGFDFFAKAHERFGQLPLLAEDLGLVTPAVRALLAETGIPGMSVVQFAGEDVRQDFNPQPDTVAYTSTHDTPTLLGWVEKSFGVHGYEASVLADRIAENAVASRADVVIMQLQDVMGLGDEARMNVPGVASGNWSWRAQAADVRAASARLTQFATR